MDSFVSNCDGCDIRLGDCRLCGHGSHYVKEEKISTKGFAARIH